MDDATPHPQDDADESALRILAELTALGMRVSRALAAQAERLAQTDPVPGSPDPGLAFNRAARTVRQTLALAKLIRQDRAAEIQRVKAARDARMRPEKVAGPYSVVKRRIEHVIAQEAEPAQRENLLRDLNRHLEDDDIVARYGYDPIDDIVAIIRTRLHAAARHAAMPAAPPDRQDPPIPHPPSPHNPADHDRTHPRPTPANPRPSAPDG